MRQSSGKASGPAVDPAGSFRERRSGGAATVAALWLAVTAVTCPGLAAPGMSREEAAAVIARTRQWVQGYMESLPNFTCRKAIRVFVVPAIRKPELRDWAVEIPKWVVSKRGGKPRVDESEWLVRMVKGGRESYEWISGNQRGHGWGFFGHWLKALFGQKYPTEFEWIEDGRLRGYGVHVFRTVTPRNFCQYGGRSGDNTVLVGYRGKIYIDRDSGRVLRYVAEEPIGLPKRHKVKSGRMLFDYDFRDIGDEVALLPVKSLAYTRYRGRSTLAESTFHRYQEYQSETKLDFGRQ